MMKKTILLLLALVILVGSCSDRDGGHEPQIPEGEAQVDMNLLSPGVFSKADIQSESSIKELTLLIFNGSGDDAAFEYSRHAWRKSDNGNVFTTTLKTGTDLTIYFVVNANTLLTGLSDKGILEAGKKWSEIQDYLILDTPETIGENIPSQGLPMWGMRKGQTILEEMNMHLGTINMLRSVASIDVQLTCTNFELLEGYVVYAANKGYLPFHPDKTEWIDGILRAGSPWSPAGFNTALDIKHTVEAGAMDITDVFYVYENETALSTPENSPTKPTKVVLKGIWNEGPGKETYYPLSLRYLDQTTNEYVKKQVIRNNKYSIIITNVNGDGYDSLEDAKKADDVNADYNVIAWEENEDGDIYIDGSKYLYIASRTARLSRDKDSTAEIVYRTNFSANDIKMKFTDDADFTAGGIIDTHNRFRVDIDPGSFRITTKQDYGTTDNPAILTVVVGRIQFTITMEQFDKDPTDWNEGQGIGVDVG